VRNHQVITDVPLQPLLLPILVTRTYNRACPSATSNRDMLKESFTGEAFELICADLSSKSKRSYMLP
jgi:hypothetical protein